MTSESRIPLMVTSRLERGGGGGLGRTSKKAEIRGSVHPAPNILEA